MPPLALTYSLPPWQMETPWVSTYPIPARQLTPPWRSYSSRPPWQMTLPHESASRFPICSSTSARPLATLSWPSTASVLAPKFLQATEISSLVSHGKFKQLGNEETNLPQITNISSSQELEACKSLLSQTAESSRKTRPEFPSLQKITVPQGTINQRTRIHSKENLMTNINPIVIKNISEFENYENRLQVKASILTQQTKDLLTNTKTSEVEVSVSNVMCFEDKEPIQFLGCTYCKQPEIL